MRAAPDQSLGKELVCDLAHAHGADLIVNQVWHFVAAVAYLVQHGGVAHSHVMSY